MFISSLPVFGALPEPLSLAQEQPNRCNGDIVLASLCLLTDLRQPHFLAGHRSHPLAVDIGNLLAARGIDVVIREISQRASGPVQNMIALEPTQLLAAAHYVVPNDLDHASIIHFSDRKSTRLNSSHSSISSSVLC